MVAAKFAVCFLFLAVMVSSGSAADRVFGGYFVNWAQYRSAPYTYVPKNLSPIVGKLDQLMYSFFYFNNQYKIYTVEPKDDQFVKEIMAYKQGSPQLKVIASIGGWNFQSALFSKMVSSHASRSSFIASLEAFMKEYGFDGVDLDWESPCSKQRDDYVKITCQEIRRSHDDGGKCPDDTDNLLQFIKELREALGNEKMISMASPAAQKDWKNIKMKEMSDYLDYWHVMTYDYTVSDISDSNLTAPNSPLDLPPIASGAVQWSINYTVQGYLDAGVPSSKIMVGFPLYGHTWYVPGLKGDDWKKFGLNASIQGMCCENFKQTYGARYGKGSQMCGVYMYSEIIAAGVQYYYDQGTQTAIGYLTEDSGDGWTKAGTWFTFNDKNSIEALTKYIKDKKLAGAFVFDTSQDTVDYSSGEYTYELTQALYSGLQDSADDQMLCDQSERCNVCSPCCKNYLTNHRDCKACVTIYCK